MSWERGMQESAVDDMTCKPIASYCDVVAYDSVGISDGLLVSAAALIYGCRCGESRRVADPGSSRGDSRFDLREYAGEERDFMAGGGAAFVEAALESTGRPCF